MRTPDRGILHRMGDVTLSDLIDPAVEARLRAVAAGNTPATDPPAPVEAKADADPDEVELPTGRMEVKEDDVSSTEMEHKAAPLGGGTQVLESDEKTGRVVALVSVTGVEDRVKDIIEPGAYTETMKTREPIGVWSHDDKTWVARTEDAVELMPGDPFFDGLKTMDGQPWPKEAGAVKVEALFNLETPHGKAAFSDVNFFAGKTGWSIGYRATKAFRNVRTGVRRIKSLDWFEYSPVMVGAASQPMTLAVKSMSQPVDPDDDHGLVDTGALAELSEAEVEAYFQMKADLGLEVKDIVRTPGGARRFGQPIGTHIVKDRVPASGLQVGDAVDFTHPGPGGPSDPVTVKGNITATSQDGNIVSITVNGEKHKLIATSPIDIRRAEGTPGGTDNNPAGSGGGLPADAPLASAEAVKARLEDLPDGGTVVVEDGGETRKFTRQGDSLVAEDGRKVPVSAMAGPLFTISSRDGSKVTFSGNKPADGEQAAAGRAANRKEIADDFRDGHAADKPKPAAAAKPSPQEQQAQSQAAVKVLNAAVRDAGGSSQASLRRIASDLNDNSIDLPEATAHLKTVVADLRTDAEKRDKPELAQDADRVEALIAKINGGSPKAAPAKQGAPKVPAGGLNSAGRGKPDAPEAARERDQRAAKAKDRERADLAAADQRTRDREKLAAVNRKRKAKGQAPLLKLPPEAKADDELLEEKGSTASLDRSSRHNWVEDAGDLPAYVREVARGIEKAGHPLDEAIPIAISRIKRWAAGGDNVTAETRAKAVKAVAEWEALKAKNRAKFDSELLSMLERKAEARAAAIDDAWALLEDTGEIKSYVTTVLGIDTEAALSTPVEEPVETKAAADADGLVDITELVNRGLILHR